MNTPSALRKHGRPLWAFASVLAIVAAPAGCLFSNPTKRFELEDDLTVEADMALRVLDGSDISNAIPSLSALASNAERMDELGLRVQAMLLTARALESEATLWPAERRAALHEAALRRADAALAEAEDWRRFEPEEKEAALLAHDARILRAGLAGEPAAVRERLLTEALADQARVGDRRGETRRAAAWRLALAGLRMEDGRLDMARADLAKSRAALAQAEKSAEVHDPGLDALRVAMAEAEGDLALRAGDPRGASERYARGLEQARRMRRRGEIKRLLEKLAQASDRSGEADRAAWYRRRAEGVAGPPVSDAVRGRVAELSAPDSTATARTE